MSEMVERVAPAMHAANKQAIHANAEIENWDECGPYLQNKYRAIARAAIAAMREPTVAMLENVTRQVANKHGRLYAAEDAWRDMIDEALKEPTNG